ncbi:hypothetical protein EDC04DRAFT_2605832 [Pisolithus marmoratus]|nr:hypothetical protein EDC04DRAFT_2605832 [Pisolithus marmoratus]
MHLQWFPCQAESFPLTPLNHNGDSSEENTLSSSSTVMPHAMNIDDSWSDATSPTVSKPSKPPIDAHAIIASTSRVAENPAPRANRCMPATMQKATTENPHSEAATNTAVVIRSMEPNLVDNPHPVAAANTAIVSSMGFNSVHMNHSFHLVFANLTFAEEQAKECNELIKTFEGAQLTIEQQHNSALAQVQGGLEGGAQVIRCMMQMEMSSLHSWQKSMDDSSEKLGNQDRIIEQQRAALEDLQAGFGMLQAKLDCEITRVNAEKEAQFVALMEKFKGTLCQVEAFRSPIQMQKEAEVVALAQKFEDALCQVEVSKSQIQMEKATEIVALAQKFEGALCQEHVRELFGNIFSVTRDKDFLSHESPSHEVVMSFTKGDGPGPDPIDLQWDLTSPVSSLWNQAVVEILLDKLHALCTEEKWTTKLRSD